MRHTAFPRTRYGARLASLAARTLRARITSSSGHSGGRHASSWNSLFRQSRLREVEGPISELRGFDLSLHSTLTDPRLKGQIQFEYGLLVDFVQSWEGLRVLDVGTGRSTMPRWMASRGARVTTLDYPTQVEHAPAGWLDRLNETLQGRHATVPPHVGASMLALPFRDESFDLVTCFSVVEHLDTDLRSLQYVPPDEQARRLATTLGEFVRVTRRGGRIYLTTECCDYERAEEDAWKPAYYYRGDGPSISAAWPIQRLRDLVYEPLITGGCVLEGPDGVESAAITDPDTWTFRGPYFSALAVLVRRGDG